jgi:carbon storage regulator
VLVFTRRAEEKIVIGANIVITVLAIKGTTVRIGIEAPADVRVDRDEVRRLRDG